jgi:hypothetical protein
LRPEEASDRERNTIKKARQRERQKEEWEKAGLDREKAVLETWREDDKRNPQIRMSRMR